MHARSEVDYDSIISLVTPGSKVLDLGCGDGSLLARLVSERNVTGRGVDIEERMIIDCISRGISVVQGNLDEGLSDYGNQSYDYVILHMTLQAVHQPVMLLREMLRVGRQVIVSVPNFGQIMNRLQLLLRGTMPVNKQLPYAWHDTPNIHFCTSRDFVQLCRDECIIIRKSVPLRRGHRIAPFLVNMRADEVCYLLEGQGCGDDNTGI